MVKPITKTKTSLRSFSLNIFKQEFEIGLVQKRRGIVYMSANVNTATWFGASAAFE
jgi:hypothetical protein